MISTDDSSYCPDYYNRTKGNKEGGRIEDWISKHPEIEIVFIESGGDNLSATFSPDLADVTIFVISVAGGSDIPRKGGPGITRSDLLVINKKDLAPYVKADLKLMEEDSRKMRNGEPFVFTNMMNDDGLDSVIQWIKYSALLEADAVEPKVLR